jgi:spermidine/putrescine transport system substrate-binding protein
MIEANPKAWDIININTPFVRDRLHPRGFIEPVTGALAARVREIGNPFARFISAAINNEGHTIGVPQRCGPFNLVINRNRIACASARKQGFSLALEQSFQDRFGILAYEDFNVMHIAIAEGLNPFESFDDFAFQVFPISPARF